MRNRYQEQFEKLKCCVIMPTYNNGATLANVLNEILGYTLHVIVVNDGSTDNTAEILAKYADITIINLKRNKGKGNALRTGFKVALDAGYQYAISIDSDGQHSAGDLPSFLAAAKEHPGSLFVGKRNMGQKGVPGKSSFGHKFSNFWFKVETGIDLPDTQSGYRLYPLKELSGIRLITNKFEFEIEVLVRAAWENIPVKSIPVKIYYAQGEDRVTHFRPFKDFFRISVLNTLLVTLALLYYRPVSYFRDFSFQKLKVLLGSGESTIRLSSAIGFGVFMGIIPVWGYQMITAAFFAHLIKLNKALVVLASNISIPPLIPFIIYGSFMLGKVFVSSPVMLNFDQNLTLDIIKKGIIQYLVGSVVLAICAGLVLFILTYIFLTIKRKVRANNNS